jgi:hypothetical protein
LRNIQILGTQFDHGKHQDDRERPGAKSFDCWILYRVCQKNLAGPDQTPEAGADQHAGAAFQGFEVKASREREAERQSKPDGLHNGAR